MDLNGINIDLPKLIEDLNNYATFGKNIGEVFRGIPEMWNSLNLLSGTGGNPFGSTELLSSVVKPGK